MIAKRLFASGVGVNPIDLASQDFHSLFVGRTAISAEICQIQT